MKRLASVLIVIAATAGCEKSKETSEEAPIQKGSSPKKLPPPPPPVVDAAVAVTPPPAEQGGTAMVPPPAAAGDLRPPAAADLPGYLEGIAGNGKLMATIATTMGDFHCELFEKEAPMTVANFVGLAIGKKPWKDPKTGELKKNVPFFNGILFHRVIPQFMVQTGDPLGQGVGGPGYEFDNEIVPALKHDVGGVLSMANAGPGTNGSQFFVTEIATPWLDGKHTVFGKCAEVDLVKKITGVPKNGDTPVTPISIKTVKISRKG